MNKNKITIIFMILAILFMLLGLVGCEESPMKKPFTIINKFHREYECKFYYEDINGQEEVFYDKCDLYHVGDTLK